MAKMYFYYGAMGSSKTAAAIMTAYNYKERGQSALCVGMRWTYLRAIKRTMN